jgi:hypothetical protein
MQISHDIDITPNAMPSLSIQTSKQSLTDLVFRKKFLKISVDLICHSAAFMKYWAGLHSAADAVQLQQGADALLNLALGTSARRNDADTSGVRRLTNHAEGDMVIDEDEDTDDLDA